VTAYAGARLWRGGEFWVNPEIDQGFGLSGTLGAAGFPSGEAFKIVQIRLRTAPTLGRFFPGNEVGNVASSNREL